MRTGRLLLAGVALSCLGLGAAVGARLANRVDLATRAAAPANGGAALPVGPLPGPDFSAIARRATPAVVNISAVQVIRSERSPFFSDPFFRDFFGRDLPFRIPQEERKTSLGSGVMIGADGLIVTNNHVIEHARQIAITIADHRRLRGKLVGTDPVTDIAVVQVEGRALPTLPWGDSSHAGVGEYVVAIGNPYQLNQTVTMGIISAVGRSNMGITDYEDFIQTDAAINPGNSGGALVNVRGELIGINTAIYSETGGYQGIGFAVPSNLVRQVVDQLLAHGRVVRGWTGIARIAELNEDTAAELGLREQRGVVILELVRSSPAAVAGLQPGDVLTAVDGRAIESAAQLRNELARAVVGSTLRMQIVRDGRTRSLSVHVEEAGAG
ncbi:MAG TPA: Do family serine endopeptidase [Vicinamibacteria bacterium]|jgi:Do/DeqQ family serine protease